MSDEKEKELVYLLFEKRPNYEFVVGVYRTRKAANVEKKRLREAEPDKRSVTFPIVPFEVEG